MKSAKVIYKKTKAGGQKGAWRYTVIAANGEPLATSEGYTAKRGAERGLDNLFCALFEILVVKKP